MVLKNLQSNLLDQYVGQEQMWFLCRIKEDKQPSLSKAESDEFKNLKWATLHETLEEIVWWKKKAYEQGFRALGIKL